MIALPSDQRQIVELRLDVQGAGGSDEFTTRFDPNSFCGGEAPDLVRPDFLAIVSSATLANMLARKASGRVNGFVVEGPTAGGHNAPPRGRLQLSVEGEPVYGDRDVPDLEAIRALGLPFWLAGSYAEPARLAEALRLGAAGVQIGTAFAYCEESGLDHELKERVLAMSRTGRVRVFTDPIASPTGFPFKVLQMEDTHSDPTTYEKKTRICDLGYLRQAYKKPGAKLGWRCPAEPVEDYVRKGGDEEDTRGRKCVCNGLMANIGLGQIRRGGEQEKPLITSGDPPLTRRLTGARPPREVLVPQIQAQGMWSIAYSWNGRASNTVTVLSTRIVRNSSVETTRPLFLPSCGIPVGCGRLHRSLLSRFHPWNSNELPFGPGTTLCSWPFHARVLQVRSDPYQVGGTPGR